MLHSFQKLCGFTDISNTSEFIRKLIAQTSLGHVVLYFITGSTVVYNLKLQKRLGGKFSIILLSPNSHLLVHSLFLTRDLSGPNQYSPTRVDELSVPPQAPLPAHLQAAGVAVAHRPLRGEPAPVPTHTRGFLLKALPSRLLCSTVLYLLVKKMYQHCCMQLVGSLLEKYRFKTW